MAWIAAPSSKRLAPSSVTCLANTHANGTTLCVLWTVPTSVWSVSGDIVPSPPLRITKSAIESLVAPKLSPSKTTSETWSFGKVPSRWGRLRNEKRTIWCPTLSMTWFGAGGGSVPLPLFTTADTLSPRPHYSKNTSKSGTRKNTPR